MTVPRCVWRNQNTTYEKSGSGDVDLPTDACFPPYGYPLYYKRAARIGINLESNGATNQSHIKIITTLANLKGSDPAKFSSTIKSLWQQIEDADEGWNADRTKAEQEFINYIKGLVASIEEGGEVNKAAVINFVETAVNKLDVPVAMANQVSKRLQKNAQKIYSFIRKIAEENLGKKFLVKMPKEVNPYYQNNVQALKGTLSGPFGFKPWPASNDPRDFGTASFNAQLAAARQLGTGQSITKNFLSNRYGPTPEGFSNDLRVNYNPITNSLVANYAPASQGGWTPFDLYSAGSTNAIVQGLFPMDAGPITDSSTQRIQCYVRFDNSQELSFGSVPRGTFTQQVVIGGQIVPDVNYDLDNTTNGTANSISPDNPALSGPKSIAFMKATVDPEFYYAPKLSVVSAMVHGRNVKDIGADSKPKKIFNCETGKYDNSFTIHDSVFAPLPIYEAVNEDENLIDEPENENENENQDEEKTDTNSNKTVVGKVEVLADGSGQDQSLKDTDHVYVLVTLPARVRPEVDSQLRDGALQEFNQEDIKHYMGQDVVRGIPGFEAPGIAGTPTKILDRTDLNPIPLSAREAIKQARGKLAFALPQAIEFTSPSPVIPDLFAVPLENKERTYGPWTSSTTGTSVDIGGNVEYSKDENLAPWNYGGYELMNAAGNLQAEFSNSLLLSSERGAFSVPDYPQGIAIAKFLTQGGPLVTNITVKVGTNGVETGYTMDLYTASFGKLQKQKADAIDRINRERQKMLDERNANIRSGISKASTNNTLNRAIEYIKTFNPFGTDSEDSSGSWSNPSIPAPPTTKIMSAVATPETEVTVAGGDSLSDAGAPETVARQTQAGGQVPPNAVGETGDKFADFSQMGEGSYNSASSDVGTDDTGYTESPRHKLFPPKGNPPDALKRLVYGADFDNITKDRAG